MQCRYEMKQNLNLIKQNNEDNSIYLYEYYPKIFKLLKICQLFIFGICKITCFILMNFVRNRMLPYLNNEVYI